MESCSVATHLSLAGVPARQRRLRQQPPRPSLPPSFKGPDLLVSEVPLTSVVMALTSN